MSDWVIGYKGKPIVGLHKTMLPDDLWWYRGAVVKVLRTEAYVGSYVQWVDNPVRKQWVDTHRLDKQDENSG